MRSSAAGAVDQRWLVAVRTDNISLPPPKKKENNFFVTTSARCGHVVWVGSYTAAASHGWHSRKKENAWRGGGEKREKEKKKND